ncbi:penicillin-binding transpeptidase domain-containing protein [Nocardiopsis algeriensis]|uniref:Cell division protein FtsI/penicillin-binding protein 2 n=1 Tax=Nocardiopsis algeriensis TaxID=1478215 RepID=A0A841IJ85_9ACTN|nr:hypothetical protein [Nocardiopsis algeriensis]
MSPRPLGRFTAAGSGLLLAATLAACTPNPSPEVAVRSFLLAWQDGDLAQAATYTDGSPEEVERALKDMSEQLDLASLRFGMGPVSQEGDSASAEFDVQADLGIGDPTWEYTGRMSLAWGADGWRIAWSPSVLHPELSDEERLAVSYEIQERGQILDRSGRPLVSADRVTAFGVVPAEMEDKEAGVTQLAELLDEDPGPLLNRVRSAPPEQFQPLVLMRDVDPSLLDEAGRIPGVDVEEMEINMTPTAAPFLVGEVAGTAEHRVSSRVPGPYQAGDTVGLSGLQNIYQHELAGSATTQVVTLDSGGQVTDVLEDWEGERSGVVETTLDLDVQRAAEHALSSLPGNGYLVAVDTATGGILAAAGGEGAADDAALAGSFAPGTAFTPVAALAALESGAVTASDPVPCDQQTQVGDRTFTNPSGGFLSGEPDIARNIAFSCSVGFAELGTEVGAEALAGTAERLGIGQEWQLSVPSDSGTVEVAADEAAVAAAMVGEEGVRVSPLAMALAAAAVADGAWHEPFLVGEGSEGTSFDEAHLAPVRQGLRDAVVERMPMLLTAGGEEELHGQAARVEQDDTSLHWFVGYQGGVAFAVVAEVDPSVTLVQQHAVNTAQAFLGGMANGVPETTEAGAETWQAPLGEETSLAEADLTGGGAPGW